MPPGSSGAYALSSGASPRPLQPRRPDPLISTTPRPARPGQKLFGTDGVRGRAGEFPLDLQTVEAIGYFLAQILRRDRKVDRPRVVVAWDGRESGPGLATALAAGLRRGNGEMLFAGLLPTPGVAYLTRLLGADAGISISASHNPWQDNGIKIFSPSGEKLPSSEEQEIESHLLDGDRPVEPVPASSPAPPVDPSLEQAYVRFLADSDGNPDLAGLTIVVDAANGAASSIAPRLFETLGARVIADAVSPDGRNINDGVGALHPERLAARVKDTGADLGVALDGDADRLIMVDSRGEIWDGDDILHLSARDLQQRGELTPAVVVATVMSNFALEEELDRLGVELVRTPVGDKYVWAEMVRLGAHLGGEQSGHLIFRPEATTGDGLLAALRVAAIVVASGRRLSEHRALRKLPQLLRNVRVAERRPLEEVPEISAELAEARQRLEGQGRLLVRYSGTEPLIRVMAEGRDETEVREIVDRLVGRIASSLGTA